MFPPAEHKLLLTQLANSIEAIVSQRLVPGLDGKRRPAVEILRGSPATGRYIQEEKLNELVAYMQRGESGMQTFDQHLLAMYQAKQISGDGVSPLGDQAGSAGHGHARHQTHRRHRLTLIHPAAGANYVRSDSHHRLTGRQTNS